MKQFILLLCFLLPAIEVSAACSNGVCSTRRGNLKSRIIRFFGR